MLATIVLMLSLAPVVINLVGRNFGHSAEPRLAITWNLQVGLPNDGGTYFPRPLHTCVDIVKGDMAEMIAYGTFLSLSSAADKYFSCASH